MRSKTELIQFVHNSSSEHFVLATLVGTEGSSYRKKGALKVISPDGQSAGLISGGCLEHHIVEHGLKFLRGEESKQLVIDTRGEYDRLLGSNLGCQGKLNLEFVSLDKETVLSDRYLGISREEELNLHVFGAGPDIDPLYELFRWTQWNVRYYTRLSDLARQRQDEGWPMTELGKLGGDFSIKNPQRSAAILMSHNYPYDLDILAKLLPYKLPYIGILGPEKRMAMMKEDLKKLYHWDLTAEDEQKIYAPIGIPNLGRGGPAIALAIVAELQQVFYGQGLAS